MARPQKKGLDYFPTDVNVFNDIKTRKLFRDGGVDTWCVYNAMLGMIYRNGYFLDDDKDLTFIISEILLIDEDRAEKGLRACVKAGLFSREMLEKDGVYTSVEIQEQYMTVARHSRRKAVVREHSLLPEAGNDNDRKKPEAPVIAAGNVPEPPVLTEDDIPDEDARKAFMQFADAYPGKKGDRETEFRRFRSQKGRSHCWKRIAAGLPERLPKFMAWRERRKRNGLLVTELPTLSKWLDINAMTAGRG